MSSSIAKSIYLAALWKMQPIYYGHGACVFYTNGLLFIVLFFVLIVFVFIGLFVGVFVVLLMFTWGYKSPLGLPSIDDLTRDDLTSYISLS